MHQHIANATFKVICDEVSGSGFSFCEDSIVITNLHVIESKVDFKTGTVSSSPVLLMCENGEFIESKVMGVNKNNDTAILKLNGPLPQGREVLQPLDGFLANRGRKIIFTGYPHGLNELLAHEGTISSPLPADAFNIDGMANGGNSGGPIVEVETGKVIGILSARRFIGDNDMKKLKDATNTIIQQCQSIRQAGTVISAGFNVADLNQAYATGLSMLTAVLENNANSGIAIGLPIAPALKDIMEMKSKGYI